MKNNISYYRHETGSHNHWKFKTLRKKFGWAGEGRFWALNNMISECDNCMLDITDESKIVSLAIDIDLSAEEFLSFINFLVDNVRLLINENGFITTGIVQEVLADVSKKRSYQRNWAKEKSNIERGNQSIETTVSNIESELSTIEKQQSKVKESKVKERESTARPPDLSKSNLFRKPVIPDLANVLQTFKQQDGTPEMAEAFFNKHSATEWFINGSPIRNFVKLVPGFITNWKKFQQDEIPAQTTGFHGIQLVQ